MNDKVSITWQVRLGAHLKCDAAPALKLVRAWWAVWHAALVVEIVEAGGAGPVVVGLAAAAQALTVAALPVVCAGQLALIWTHWERENNKGRGELQLLRAFPATKRQKVLPTTSKK